MFWSIFLQTLTLIVAIIVAGLLIDRIIRGGKGES